MENSQNQRYGGNYCYDASMLKYVTINYQFMDTFYIHQSYPPCRRSSVAYRIPSSPSPRMNPWRRLGIASER
jgi:hypothetical protein